MEIEMAGDKISFSGSMTGVYGRDDIVFEEGGLRVKDDLIRVDKFLWK
jgi:hypothetical protein